MCVFSHPWRVSGLHFLASTLPIPSRTAEQLAARMPSSAITDMMEWGPESTRSASSHSSSIMSIPSTR